jgi:uncharacterized protein (DUF486 family)
MTIAWYGHLKFKSSSLLFAIPICWLIALPEYALQVPANRLGSQEYRWTATQLKVIQEVISLTVFAVFAFFYFKEVPNWRSLVAFGLIAAAAYLVMPQSFDGTHDAPAATEINGSDPIHP